MSYYTSPNFSELTPLPVTDYAGNPYNYTNTPFIGLPSGSLPQAFLDYCNNTGTLFEGTPVNGVVSTTSTNAGITTTTYSYPGQGLPRIYAANGAPVDSTGNPVDTTKILASGGQGTKSECTNSFIAQQWQAFFYVFQPYIDNPFFQTVKNTLSDSTVVESNLSYYTELFETNFVKWMRYRKTNHTTDPTNSSSFVTYLQNKTEMGYRQRSVIFWSFLRIVDMLTELEPRTLNAGRRSIIWNRAAFKATDEMKTKGESIPSIQPSSEDVRVPDPDSISAQSDVMMEIEQLRSYLNIDQEYSRTEEANMSFSGDGISQQRATLNSFWSSLNTIMTSVLT
jgi:hypothetical protein